MEAGLLNLSAAVGGAADPEVIHNLFRAAHSIKGASATFGFEEISRFTHMLEAILDLMREGGHSPRGPAADVLLQAVDCLRELIKARIEGRTSDVEMLDRATAGLAAILESTAGGGDTRGSPDLTPLFEHAGRYHDLRISFRPYLNLFASASDPLRNLSDLSKLGTLSATIHLTTLPELSSLNTDHCHLAWDVGLANTSATLSEVRELFSWLDGRCELEITEVAPANLDRPAQAQPLVIDRPPLVEQITKPERARSRTKDSGSIRVGTEKIDCVVNLVGELVITQSMLSCIGDNFKLEELGKLREGIAQLTRNTRELQETVLKMRMLPIGTLFERFPRLVHDLNSKLQKSVQLRITGEQTEVDKTVLERLGDPLMHLIRNSLDHGIESSVVRQANGKSASGTLRLHAEHKGGNIVIEVSDDGGGLNEERIMARARERGLAGKNDTPTAAEIHAFIFEPGFSTVERVTDISGRGVGMDVVRRNVEDLGGRIDLESRAGVGTTTVIQLPLTLAIMDGQLMRVGQQRFVVPLVAIVESVRIVPSSLKRIAHNGEVYRWRGEYLQVVNLHKVFDVEAGERLIEDGLLVIVESRSKRMALFVDDLLAQQQVVIKSLETNFGRVEGVSGATILGDGTVAMILDIAGVMDMAKACTFDLEQEWEKTK